MFFLLFIQLFIITIVTIIFGHAGIVLHMYTPTYVIHDNNNNNKI